MSIEDFLEWIAKNVETVDYLDSLYLYSDSKSYSHYSESKQMDAELNAEAFKFVKKLKKQYGEPDNIYKASGKPKAVSLFSKK